MPPVSLWCLSPGPRFSSHIAGAAAKPTEKQMQNPTRACFQSRLAFPGSALEMSPGRLNFDPAMGPSCGLLRTWKACL